MTVAETLPPPRLRDKWGIKYCLSAVQREWQQMLECKEVKWRRGVNYGEDKKLKSDFDVMMS